MDISLKDEYSMGYSVNGDIAAGTRERYLGKIFGFLLTKTLTVGGFVNFNNINDETRTMWGNWGATSSSWGVMPDKRKGAGFSLSYQSKNVETEDMRASLRIRNFTTTCDRTNRSIVTLTKCSFLLRYIHLTDKRHTH